MSKNPLWIIQYQISDLTSSAIGILREIINNQPELDTKYLQAELYRLIIFILDTISNWLNGLSHIKLTKI